MYLHSNCVEKFEEKEAAAAAVVASAAAAAGIVNYIK